jgi:O-methyltransferase domain
MPKGGKVLLIERQIEQDHREAMRVLHIDMEMLVNVSGMERTDAEYRSLFERAGLRLTNILPFIDRCRFQPV